MGIKVFLKLLSLLFPFFSLVGCQLNVFLSISVSQGEQEEQIIRNKFEVCDKVSTLPEIIYKDEVITLEYSTSVYKIQNSTLGYVLLSYENSGYDKLNVNTELYDDYGNKYDIAVFSSLSIKGDYPNLILNFTSQADEIYFYPNIFDGTISSLVLYHRYSECQYIVHEKSFNIDEDVSIYFYVNEGKDLYYLIKYFFFFLKRAKFYNNVKIYNSVRINVNLQRLNITGGYGIDDSMIRYNYSEKDANVNEYGNLIELFATFDAIEDYTPWQFALNNFNSELICNSDIDYLIDLYFYFKVKNYSPFHYETISYSFDNIESNCQKKLSDAVELYLSCFISFR